MYPRGVYFVSVARFEPSNVIDFHPHSYLGKPKLVCKSNTQKLNGQSTWLQY